ncbi:MAG: rhamnulokinase family protein [Anaerolineae bacterium]
MALSRNFLAVDLGAESGRAILGALDQGRLTLTPIHRFPNIPVLTPDGLHWDVLRLWSEIKTGLSHAVHKERIELTAMGLDTWGVDYGLLDKQGTLISNPYHYRDSRTDGMIEEACRRMSREQIFERTGIQLMQINTLFQLLATVISGSPLLDIAQHLLMMPDLFNYWLTGQMTGEFTIATTSQCFDPRRKEWATPLLDAMDIPRRILPPIIQPGTDLGPLCAPLVSETGARGVRVIAPACHDTGSAVAAVPAEKPGFAWISSGTWSIMGAELTGPIINAQSLAYNFTNEGGVNHTIRFSKNIAGLWLVQECRHTWAQVGEELSYGELTEMAAQSKPLQSIVDPDAGEFLKPGDMPARIRAYCERTGQPVPESKGEVVRCGLESLACKYRWVLERMQEMLGHELDPIHIVGGGTQNRLLSQFTADVTGRRVITGPVEATAAGNVLLQALAVGEIGSIADARAIVRQSFPVEVFQPVDRAGWDEAYARLCALVAQPVD